MWDKKKRKKEIHFLHTTSLFSARGDTEINNMPKDTETTILKQDNYFSVKFLLFKLSFKLINVKNVKIFP